MKLVKITTIDGITFPGLIIGGILSDSRTGEQCHKADKWEVIEEKEYNQMCEDLGLND